MDNTSRIKGIAICLENYSFDQENDVRKNVFVGREKERERLKSILTPHPKRKYSGVYLVTGYRGMGKTSLVKKVISETKSANKNIINIEVSLAHDELKEIDVLKTLLKSFKDQIKREKLTPLAEHIAKISISFWLSILITLIFVATFLLSIKHLGYATDINQLIISHKYIELYEILSLTTLCFIIFFCIKGIVLLLEFGLNGLNRYYIRKSYEHGKSFAIALAFFVFPFRIFRLNTLIKRFSINLYKIKLDQLIDRATSNVNVENDSLNRYGKFKFNVFTKRVKSYQIEDARSIEYEFRQILEGFVKYGGYNIVFVLDELDKVNPIEKIFAEHSDDNYQKNSLTHEYYEKLRRRQERTIKTISNLKYLFSASDAKFIFIAGREMFDASLADISDRESALGSIFTDVIYVSSFMTESFFHSSSNITKLTAKLIEQYVCGKENSNDNEEKNSIRNIYSFIKDETSNFNNLESEIGNSLISVLQNFVVYLTYRSAGAPKKIKFFFEQNILPYHSISTTSEAREHTIFLDSFKTDTERDRANSLYLYFHPNDQYRFGLASYLFTPFIVANSTYMKNYGDKLLVSTSYLLDHLYKFHGFAFSPDTLELTPEIIAINKSPELRSFIGQIMNGLQKTHIRTISSGLHKYKFYKTIEMEIRYASRMSETDSAAFNFTLDESLQIKRYFKEKLFEINQKGIPQSRFSISKAKVASYIADLHFYDQEYDDSQHFYNESIFYIGDRHKESLEDLILFVRIKLKHGLAYERMKLFDDAYALYDTLSKEIVKTIQSLNTKPDYEYGELENTETKFSLEFSTLFYQPLISKLSVTEKDSNHEITQLMLENTKKEFNAIYGTLNLKSNIRGIVEAEFLKKIGNILYFKNCPYIEEPIKYYYDSISTTIKSHIDPVSAIKITPYQSQKIDIKELIKILRKDILENESVLIKYRSGVFLPNLATCISNIGNCLLVKCKNKEDYVDTFEVFDLACQFYKKNSDSKSAQFQLQKILYALKYSQINSDLRKDFTQKEIEKILFEDGLFSKIIREQYKTNGSVGRNELYRFLNYFNKEAVNTLNEAKINELFTPSDEHKKELYDKVSSWIPYLPINFETKTITLLVQQILLKYKICDPEKIKMSSFEVVNNKLNRIQELNLRATINFKKTSLLTKFKAENSEYNLFQINKNKGKITKNELLDIIKPNLITIISTTQDSIFCFTEILRIFKAMGTSYVNSYSLLASCHRKLGEWCLLWESLRGLKIVDKKDDYALTNLIGINSVRFVDSYYHFEQSLVNYYNSKNTHNGGGTYKELIQDMYYLEDDFNEDTSLFCAALDRNKIENTRNNISLIDLEIKKIKEQLSDTMMYDYKNYLSYTGVKMSPKNESK